MIVSAPGPFVLAASIAARRLPGGPGSGPSLRVVTVKLSAWATPASHLNTNYQLTSYQLPTTSYQMKEAAAPCALASV